MVTTPHRTRRVAQFLSPTRVDEVNRSRVIQALCDHGPMARTDLEALAGVNGAAIDSIVGALIDHGLIEERNNGATPGTLWFGARAGLSGGAVIGEGTYEAALVNARGDLIEHAAGEFDAEDMSGHAVAVAALEGLEKVLPRKREELLGIGIAVPGTCDPDTGEVIASGQVPALRGERFSQMLTSNFGREILVDNDSLALALGEKWFGSGRGNTTFASVQTGTGLGVGLVLDGNIYRGPTGTAGELGHTAVVPQGERCTCGLTGCWETIATIRWLRAEAERAQLPKAGRMDANKLRELAAESRAARRLFEDYADHLAIGLANLAHILGVTLFVLHGDAVGGGEEFRALVEQAVRERTLPGLAEEIRIVLSSLDQRAAVLGAASLVLSSAFDLRT
jgi:predicted NBD/HSP70 family sugar kinase